MSTDAQLAEGLAQQGAKGLEAVYATYSAKLYTYALTMLRDPAAAQDVVHDTFLVAAGSIAQLRDPSKLRPWLYAITRNECLRTLRGRKRFSDSDEAIDMADSTVDFDAGLRREEAARLIAQAMVAMNPADRDIVALALQHDLDVDRISEVTGDSANTVHARLSRARVGLSDAVSALALFRSRTQCEELQAIISPADQPLTPLLRKRIQRHVKSCDECEQRRRAALAAVGPAMAAPLYVSPPDTLPDRILAGLHNGEAQRLSQRAAPFDDNGFPVPLDAGSHRRWLVPAATAGVSLLVLAVVAFLMLGRGENTPAAGASAIAQSVATTDLPSLSPTPEPTNTASESVTPEEPEQIPTAKAPAPVQTSIITPDPTPTPSASQPKATKPAAKPTKTPKPKPKPTISKQPTSPPKTTPPANEQPTAGPPPAPVPPTITSASLINEDVDADGSFTRCDAFTLRITATVTGSVDTTEALISPVGATTLLTGDPLQATVTLQPGEYTVSVKATGPGGTVTRDAGTVLHICPG